MFSFFFRSYISSVVSSTYISLSLTMVYHKLSQYDKPKLNLLLFPYFCILVANKSGPLHHYLFITWLSGFYFQTEVDVHFSLFLTRKHSLKWPVGLWTVLLQQNGDYKIVQMKELKVNTFVLGAHVANIRGLRTKEMHFQFASEKFRLCHGD